MMPSQDHNGSRSHTHRIHSLGEMAELVRNFDWAKTSVGAIEYWPELLLNTVNTLLSSRQPMLLWWGQDLIQFYNDAYRTSLGTDKHPSALGQGGRECWPETWNVIAPLIENVMANGEAHWSEDQLIPIFRDRKLVDVYWTFSYSPVWDASGRVCGTLVVCSDTTVRVQAENAAKKERSRLLEVLRQAPAFFALLQGSDHVISIVNALYLRLVKNRDVVGKPVRVALPEAVEQGYVELLDRVYRGEPYVGRGARYDVYVGEGVEPDERYLDFTYQPLRESDDSVSGIIVLGVDVTEQKRSEKSLRESESRFRKLFESGLMGVAIPDRFGAFRESNDELLRMTGYTRADQEAGLVRWDTMTPPEYADLDAAHIREAAEHGSCTPYEKEYIRKDGTRVPILCGYALLEGSEDEYIGFVLDLSEQKQAERELREREERFRILAESLPDFVWMREADGEYVYCNQHLLDYVGQPPEWLRTHSFEVVHPDDRALTLDKWKQSMETGEPYLNEYRVRRSDGMYRYFLARAVPLKNAAGRIERWIGSSTDIHDQKLAEDALRKSEKLATAGRLAASIAHEINNPLAAVTNSLYLALQDDSLKTHTKSHLQTAEQELRRVAHITTQTLRFHKQTNSPAPVDICDIVESVLAFFAQRLANKNIRIKTKCERGAFATCFADEVRQVVAHLVSNALDATRQDGSLYVRVTRTNIWRSEPSYGVKIVVADTGHGIPPAILEHIFEPFISTKEATGVGLGLWVSDGIVRKHGGRILVRSRATAKPSGSVFSVFIPSISSAPPAPKTSM